MNFKNLKGAEITAQSTARFTFYNLAGEPWLLVRPAGETNRPYFNAVLKRQSARRGVVARVITAEQLERNRNEDRELYAEFVWAGEAGGWLDDTTNAPVTMTRETVRELLQQLPADQFDELRVYCNQVQNFRPDMPSAEETQVVAGNSPTG